MIPAAEKLTEEDRIELTRGLTSEYATVKSLLPRARKPLEFDAKGTWDQKQWAEVAKESGPAARNGDLVQVTKIDIDASWNKANPRVPPIPETAVATIAAPNKPSTWLSRSRLKGEPK